MDRRIRKTKNSIKNLLLQLMEKDPANRITVTEICNILDINRSTFYSHYEGIDDVLYEIEDELMDEIIIKARNQGRKEFNVVLSEISSNISMNKHTYQILVKSYEAHFVQKLGLTVSSLLALETKKDSWQPKLEHSYDYIRAFMVSGIVGLLLEWLKHDCSDTIPAVSKELIKYFDFTAIDQA